MRAMQARRDQALLQTYTSEKDIESVRRRALADNRRRGRTWSGASAR